MVGICGAQVPKLPCDDVHSSTKQLAGIRTYEKSSQGLSHNYNPTAGGKREFTWEKNALLMISV